MAERYFMVSASEVQEEPAPAAASRLAGEIHDLMCSCHDAERCNTLGVKDTILEALSTLLAQDKWSGDFEDGWIQIEWAPPLN